MPSENQVPYRPPRQVGQPPAPEVLAPTVEDVAALAEVREVGAVAVRGVAMARRQHDAGGAVPVDDVVLAAE